MATAADETTFYDSGGAGEKLRTDQELEEMLKQVAATITTFLHRYFHLTTIENLPEEILLNIFHRLLSKHLSPMKLVSKSWNLILSQPSFVKSHLHRSLCNNNDRVLLVFRGYNRFTEYSFSFDQSPHLEPTNLIKQTPDNLSRNVIGAVNGLICLFEPHSDIQIWNPSLSIVSTIPPPYPIPSEYHCRVEIFMRFGYDSKTDDYKIVKLTGVRSRCSWTVTRWLQVQVYSMRKGSWKLIPKRRFPSHMTPISDTDYLCLDGYDGYLHWENETSIYSKEDTILAFDLGSETFREIPLPDSVLGFDHSGRHRLGVLSRKLCEMSWRTDGVCEVWVMEEYGVPESWVKRHVFSQFNGVFEFYGFTLRSELLFGYRDGRLGLYDPDANTTKLTRTEEEVYKIVEYVDSLVWV